MATQSELPARVRAIVGLRVLLDNAITCAHAQKRIKQAAIDTAEVELARIRGSLIRMEDQQAQLEKLYIEVNNEEASNAHVDLETLALITEYTSEFK